MQIVVNEVLPSIANKPMHWKTRMKEFKKFHMEGYWAIFPHAEEILKKKKPITIKLIRQGPRHLDFDNLVYAFKPFRDGIAEALWPKKSLRNRDDHKDVKWEYGQVKNKLRNIIVEIYDAKQALELQLFCKTS